MAKGYSKLEQKIINVFKKDQIFNYLGETYNVITVDKPRPIKGECKTDVYIAAENIKNKQVIEVKLSVKKESNSEFLENKINEERAFNIFGENWKHIFINQIRKIYDRFANRPLIYLEKDYPTQANSITLGWKAEISSRNRELAVELPLNKVEINKYILKGENLVKEKKDSFVDGNVIQNSGVADYIIYTEEKLISSAQYIIDNMKKIDEFEIENAYLIFTANNYRPLDDIEYDGKTDSDRTLALAVKWTIENERLTPEFLINEPLKYNGRTHMKPFLIDCLKKIGKDRPTLFDLKNDLSSISYVYSKSSNWPSESNFAIMGNVSGGTTMNVTEDLPEIKVNEKGRGKFKPAPDYKSEDVKRILEQKILEENTKILASEIDNDYLKNIQYNENKINVISLFSGCGGLDLGFELAGLSAVVGEDTCLAVFKDKEKFDAIREKSIFHTIYSNDLFKEANVSYKENFPETVFQHELDIRKVRNFPKADLVIGGFPCPGFSEAGPRLIDDERNFLYIHFIRCLTQAKPAVFVAENVKGMLTLGKGEVIRQIAEDFAAAGYRVQYKLLNARDYGVPQLRERVFLVGVREDLDFEYNYPEPTHGEAKGLQPYVTLRDAIGDLEANPGPYFTGSYSSIYMSRNRKKRWDEQSFTIQASGRQAPLHPGGVAMEKVGTDKWIFPDGEEKHRRLSVKEIARIQTFPDWYYFDDSGNMKVQENNRLDKQYKQIGNAVPVLLAKAVAAPIAEWAKDYLKIRLTDNTQQLNLF